MARYHPYVEEAEAVATCATEDNATMGYRQEKKVKDSFASQWQMRLHCDMMLQQAWCIFHRCGTPRNKYAYVVTMRPIYNIDTNWYFDIDATDHITGDLDMLTVKDN